MAGTADDRCALRIFDLIDAGKLGSAEGVLETALEKYPQNHAVRAAEALLLLKQQHIEKAKAKAEVLSRQKLKDGKAINALIHVLQECCLWDSLLCTYEGAKEFQNEQTIMENIFQTYVRMGAYDMAQKIALQLHRQWAQPRYQVWSVQANLAQVPPGTSDHILLKLSTRVLDASILTEKGLVTPSTSRMYVDVLLQQGQYAEALAFLCSSRGASVGLIETRLELVVAVLRGSGDLARANAVAKHLWARHPDNWTYVDMYLGTLHRSDGATNDSDGVLTLDGHDETCRETVDMLASDHTLDDAIRFCRALILKELEATSTAATGGKTHRLSRGPFMAELEILSRGGCEMSSVALQEAVLAYAKRFYRNACCYLDLSTYLDKASSADIYTWSMVDEEPEIKKESGDTDKLDQHARRILGLRCHVSQWGDTKAQQPEFETALGLFTSCVDLYNMARPLSTHLVWSEEGLCDGYITVCLNIALHVYHATRDLQWPVKALELLDGVDRKMNNPTWLMYSVCFARILGLTDVAACRQLAFKSVQHDTMSHIGYWPLFAGCAVEELVQWNELAWTHYRSLPKDCSLLRSKVFAFTSWPAMRDVQEYELRQMNSLARSICLVHRIAAALLQCQTQRNVFDLMESEAQRMVEAYEALSPSHAARLVDNTDWTTARSMVLGNIHGEKVHALTDTLIDLPDRDTRVDQAQRVLGGLMLLHDIALLEDYRMRLANVPRPKKQKGCAASASAAAPSDAIPPPTLLCDVAEPVTLRVTGAIAPALIDFVRARGAVSVAPNTALRDALVIEELNVSFLFPEAIILSSLMQVGNAAKLPIAAWAKDLHAAVEHVRERHRGAEVVYTGHCVGKLYEEKSARVEEQASDLLRDLVAAGRRR